MHQLNSFSDLFEHLKKNGNHNTEESKKNFK